MKFKTSLLLVALCVFVSPVWAKKNKNDKKEDISSTQETSPVAKRLAHLSTEDARLFDALSQEQKDKIKQGQIDMGFNAWMVKLALGEPFYGTEHHPVFTDYEEVWLYTKPDIINEVDETKIMDPQTNWPTIHRKTKIKTCYISDFFVLWDRGVVQAVHKVTDKQTHGKCTIETQEAFLPIVDGKPVQPK